MQVLRQYSGLGRTTARIPDETGIIVCTIEKANSLVNFMTAEGTLAQSISTVIVDELHMVDDEDRGYLLELLLTKLRFLLPAADPGPGAEAPSSGGAGTAARTQGLVSQFLGSAQATQAAGAAGVQLIGMSATLPNVDLIGSWLNAVVYRTTFRPVRTHPCLGRSLACAACPHVPAPAGWLPAAPVWGHGRCQREGRRRRRGDGAAVRAGGPAAERLEGGRCAQPEAARQGWR